MKPSLYRQLLGARFDTLPAALRHLHDLEASTQFSGDAEVFSAVHPLARLIARLTGFPTRSYRCQVSVRIEVDAEGETWRRCFGEHCFSSRLFLHRGALTEQLGVHRIQFKLSADENGLSMHPIAWRTLGIPLPRMLWPCVDAVESEVDGAFRFDVATAFPIIGKVIHYRGALRPAGLIASVPTTQGTPLP